MSTTTLNIRDETMALARGAAVASGTTVRAFVEEAVREKIARMSVAVEPREWLPNGRPKKAQVGS